MQALIICHRASARLLYTNIVNTSILNTLNIGHQQQNNIENQNEKEKEKTNTISTTTTNGKPLDEIEKLMALTNVLTASIHQIDELQNNTDQPKNDTPHTIFQAIQGDSTRMYISLYVHFHPFTTCSFSFLVYSRFSFICSSVL
jgi:hypothetical protein